VPWRTATRTATGIELLHPWARQREGLGRILLVEAIYKVAAVASAAGGIGLFVDAKDQAAAAFYSRFGFEATPTQPLALFMPVQTVRRLAQS
jgi:hypothetical protein